MSTVVAVKVCTIQGCEKKLLARGWCAMHYWRWQQKGSALWVPNPPSRSERFWAQVDQSAGCWLWQGCLGGNGDGYGVFGAHPQVRCHRFAYEEVVGPVPLGMSLDHTCHNADVTCLGGPACLHRRCVRPDHLEIVTGVENFFRSRNTPDKKTHCPQGHPYDLANTYVRSEGWRGCRTCRAAASQRSKLRGVS